MADTDVSRDSGVRPGRQDHGRRSGRSLAVGSPDQADGRRPRRQGRRRLRLRLPGDVHAHGPRPGQVGDAGRHRTGRRPEVAAERHGDRGNASRCAPGPARSLTRCDLVHVRARALVGTRPDPRRTSGGCCGPEACAPSTCRPGEASGRWSSPPSAWACRRRARWTTTSDTTTLVTCGRCWLPPASCRTAFAASGTSSD